MEKPHEVFRLVNSGHDLLNVEARSIILYYEGVLARVKKVLEQWQA